MKRNLKGIIASHETFDLFNRYWLNTIRVRAMIHHEEIKVPVAPGEMIGTIKNDSTIYLILGTTFGDITVGGRSDHMVIGVPVQLEPLLDRKVLYPEDVVMIFGDMYHRRNLHFTLVALIDESIKREQKGHAA